MDQLHRSLARWNWAVWMAEKLRNQCDAVIRNHLGPSSRINANGESRLLEAIIPQAKVIFDVGANDGTYAESLLKRAGQGARIYCFEPNPALYAQLSRRFRDEPRVCMIEEAVGCERTSRLLYVCQESTQLSSLVPLDRRNHACACEVRVCTLDEFVNANVIDSIDFLKIDVEGFDFAALMGASQLLRDQLISIVQFEYGAGWARAGATLGAAIPFLEKLGYRVWLLQPQGLRRFEYDRWGEHFGYSNYVATAPHVPLNPAGYPFLPGTRSS